MGPGDLGKEVTVFSVVTRMWGVEAVGPLLPLPGPGVAVGDPAPLRTTL